MNREKKSRYVRLRVELVLEVEDADAVTGAALRRIAEDPGTPEPERAHAESAVTEDTVEALACLVDPFALVGDVPGVELHRASWSSEPLGHDPDSPDRDLAGDDVGEDGGADAGESGRTGGIG
ncbi:hypothetical protein ACH4F6_11650 [Streptomyces sp. NPDC017936]|uniref:hypothetical protein n=1 Tax=Streptomyces sp. NPDC017936 TaxID=3365016 RepID=UPI00378F5737